MCKEKPGTRCVNSAKKSLVSLVKTLKATTEAANRLEQHIAVTKNAKESEEYQERYDNVCKSLEKTAREINVRKAFVYAANSESDITTEAELDSLTKDCGPYEKSFLDADADLHKTGAMLRRFQDVADKSIKDNKEKEAKEEKSLNQKDLAKWLVEKAYPARHKSMLKSVTASFASKVTSDDPDTRRKGKAARAKAILLLDDAYAIAREDAEKLYKKDKETELVEV